MDWLKKDDSFKVICERSGNHEFSSQDIAPQVGMQVIDLVNDKKGYEQKVNMKHPKIIVYVFITQDKGYLGIDFSGFDMAKRDYKIFSYSQSIKANVAYAMLRLAGYNSKKILLDPFCGEGTIPIEAALFSTGRSVNLYRKDKIHFLEYQLGIESEKIIEKIDNAEKKNTSKIYCFDNNMGLISSAKKNSKIAGVNKHLTYGKVNAEWLDARLEKEEIDAIVSNSPRISKHTKESITRKLYEELFYQAEFILKQTGKIVLLSNGTEIMKKGAKKYEFKLDEERSVWLGKQELKICVFSK